jgi:hypothetical protein
MVFVAVEGYKLYAKNFDHLIVGPDNQPRRDPTSKAILQRIMLSSEITSRK